MRRWWLTVLVVAAGCGDRTGDEAPVDDSEAVETDVTAACAGWNPAACSTNGIDVCYYECLPEVRIQCTRRECFLTGRGHGRGESCVVSVGDRQLGCGFCETAFEECH